MRKMWIGIAAVLLAGCGGDPVPPVPEGSGAIDASHPASQLVAAALADGSAFEPGFLKVDDAFDEDELATTLAGMRQVFVDGATFTFVEGVEITHAGKVPVRMALQSEDGEEGSSFRLPMAERHEAYVILEAPNRIGGTHGVHVLLWERDDQWQALRMDVMPYRLGKLDFAGALSEAAKAETDGDLFVAACLYRLADQVASVPPYRDAGRDDLLKARTKELAKRLADADRTVHRLQVDSQTIEIAGVQIVPIEGKGVYLGIARQVETLPDEATREAAHLAIARALLAEDPKLKDYFAGITVMSVSNAQRQKAQTEHAMADLVGVKTSGDDESLPSGPRRPE